MVTGGSHGDGRMCRECVGGAEVSGECVGGTEMCGAEVEVSRMARRGGLKGEGRGDREAHNWSPGYTLVV